MPIMDERLISTADPAKLTLGPSGAARFARMSGLPVEKIEGRLLSDLELDFRFQVDPELFLFRRVCGRVVKTNPQTGVDYPVPFATVEVEDTDCSFLGYFPRLSPWGWYFPFRCRREVIATTQTDECGEFCVWIPRFDIDWVLRFRHERVCFPVIFQRPTIKDILEQVPPIVPPIDPRGPFPPPPDPRELDRLRERLGRGVAARIDRLRAPSTFGASTVERDSGLAAPAAIDRLRPPLTEDLRGLDVVPDDNGVAVETLASRLGIDPGDIKDVDLRHFIGPFLRCIDVFFPEWTPILDVPDITFRVLQDTNNDGVKEQIYGESHFEVRWDALPSGPIVLHAGPNALSTVLCGGVDIPCGNVPAIVMADRLPLSDPSSIGIFDPANGYALGMNRPHPSGQFDEVLVSTAATARAPFTGSFGLFGCNRTDPGATHYRLVYRYRPTGGGGFTDPTPFVGGHNVYFRATGGPLVVNSDADGWFPIDLPPTPPGEIWFPQGLLMDWQSARMADGLYGVTLELGVGGTTASSQSAEVFFVIDNGPPVATLMVETGPSAAGPFTPISTVCPVVRRGAPPAPVYFRVTLDASDPHLRSVTLGTFDCGGGAFAFLGGSGGFDDGGSGFRYWHEDFGVVSRTLVATYELPAAAAEGTYGFQATIDGRAFSPGDVDAVNATPTWHFDRSIQYVTPSSLFSVVNANP